MGTNFYWDEKHRQHIGKRSAAGIWCWDCGCVVEYKITHIECPSCHKKYQPYSEDFTTNSVGRELGLNTNPPKKKTGLASCSSFTWAITPEAFKASKRRKIYDEYHRIYTRQDFKNVLEECPINKYDQMGQDFS